jgi:ribosomal protein S18 acetylase RimI-like enzyme
MELFIYRYNFKNIFSNDFLYNKLSYEYNKDWFIGSFDDMENNCGIEYYVLEDEGIIKGYFSIGFPPDNKEVEIINFTIDVPFQQNKFGTRLMDYCMELLKNRGAEKIRLNVFEKNNIAIKFYEKYGFNIEEKMFSKDLNINILRTYKKI